MQKFWITTIILLVCCGRQSNNQRASDNYNFKKNSSKIYADLFRAQKKREVILKKESLDKSEKIQDPLPSFTSQPITNQKKEVEQSLGLFSFFSGKSKHEIKNERRQAVCEELLDINKIVVIDQNEKLISLSIEKNNMSQKINSLEKNIKNMNSGDNKMIQKLESEIIKLKRLIKILSSEIN